jgi:hypothetical protein
MSVQMHGKTRFLWPLLATLMPMAGCSTVGDYLKAEYEAAKHRDPPEIVLARQVAAARTSMTTATNLVTYRGYYGGRLDDGCHSVTVQVVQHKSSNDYIVCADTVRRVGILAPAMPTGPRIDEVRNSIDRAAWSTGKVQRGEIDGYAIESAPVGPPDAQACRLIEQRVRYGQSFVQVRTRKVCP